MTIQEEEISLAHKHTRHKQKGNDFKTSDKFDVEHCMQSVIMKKTKVLNIQKITVPQCYGLILHTV